MNDAAINDSTQIAEVYQVFALSWLAYISTFIQLVVFGTLGALLMSVNSLLGTAVLLAALILFAYQILYLRSVKLYTDHNGIWVYRGILPWNKGSYGVKWRDLNETLFQQGFTGWLFKSYAVFVTNRYTSHKEISLSHVKNGHKAAKHINDLHIHFVRANGVK